MFDSAAILQEIATEVASCTRCSLCKNRNRTVPGEGSPTARLLFIGEAPGYNEDQQGRPFVGASGDLLNKLLRAIKMPREDVFIANVVKCRPPNNQDPTPDQIAACKPYLDRQIAAIDPRVIVTLGRFSMARYWPGQRISQIHGQAKKEGGRVLVPMFHPAAALRDDRTMQLFKEDALTLPDLMVEAEELARAELWGFANLEPEPAPAPVIPAVPEAKAVAETSADYLPDAGQEGLLVPVAATEPSATPAPKASRGRKPKAAPAEVTAGEEIILSEQAVTVPAQPKPAKPANPNGRKKRTPGDGEQLTLF